MPLCVSLISPLDENTMTNVAHCFVFCYVFYLCMSHLMLLMYVCHTERLQYTSNAYNTKLNKLENLDILN